MEQITEFCTGCRTCEQLCPTQSVKIEADKEGFLIPVVNQTTCIDCMLCHKHCPQNTKLSSNPPSSVYAFRYANDGKLYHSASGGAFVALAQNYIDHGGVVYGAAYVDDDFHVAHIRVSDKKNLYKLQSSKYVQSDTHHTFDEVKIDLQKGLLVLYSGTPCQIAGLKAFLRKDYNTLLMVDIICHGVPSPLLFDKYITWLSSRISKIIEYNFRDKSTGWGLGYKVRAKDRTLTLPGMLDPYYYHFLRGNTYRECCYQCKYAKPERVSDLTIGDYWGIEKEHPEFYSTKGVSCVLVNTEKGQKWLDMIRSDAYILNSTFEKVAKHNGNLLQPTHRNEIRNMIYEGINSKPITSFMSENLKYSKPIKTLIKSFFPTSLKRMIKRFLLLIGGLVFCTLCSAEKEVYSPLFKCSPKLVEPYGICTHINREGDRWEFDTRERELKNIKLTGSSFLRVDFDWASDHRRNKKRIFELAFPLFDQMMTSVESTGLQTLGILSMCRTYDQMDEWKDYVAQMSNHYKQVRYWEVINEVDIVRRYLGWRNPPFKVEEYAPLLKAGYEEIKKSNKNAKVLFSGLSSIYNGAIDTIFSQNVTSFFDIMNMHWYTSPVGTPEELLYFFSTLSNKMKIYHIEKPLWMTEVGYSTAQGLTDELHQDIQLPRTFLICFACGVDKVFWYNGRAFEKDIAEKEDHYGLWHKDYVPKPAFYAYRTLTRLCPGNSTRPKLTRFGDIYVAKWVKPDKEKVWALWTSKDELSSEVKIQGEYKAYDNHGKKINITPENLKITPSIVYLVGVDELTIQE